MKFTQINTVKTFKTNFRDKTPMLNGVCRRRVIGVFRIMNCYSSYCSCLNAKYDCAYLRQCVECVENYCKTTSRMTPKPWNRTTYMHTYSGVFTLKPILKAIPFVFELVSLQPSVRKRKIHSETRWRVKIKNKKINFAKISYRSDALVQIE